MAFFFSPDHRLHAGTKEKASRWPGLTNQKLRAATSLSLLLAINPALVGTSFLSNPFFCGGPSIYLLLLYNSVGSLSRLPVDSSTFGTSRSIQFARPIDVGLPLASWQKYQIQKDSCAVGSSSGTRPRYRNVSLWL